MTHYRDGKWYFRDETTDEYGPYETQKEASFELDKYVLSVLEGLSIMSLRQFLARTDNDWNDRVEFLNLVLKVEIEKFKDEYKPPFRIVAEW